MRRQPFTQLGKSMERQELSEGLDLLRGFEAFEDRTSLDESPRILPRRISPCIRLSSQARCRLLASSHVVSAIRKGLVM